MFGASSDKQVTSEISGIECTFLYFFISKVENIDNYALYVMVYSRLQKLESIFKVCKYCKGIIPMRIQV